MREIDTWIFDLDNTLYPASLGLVGQINARMTGFLMRKLDLDRAAADAYRHRTWVSHGITLRALVEEHGVDAAAFLAETHDIDYGPLVPNPALTRAIAALPGRKLVHTNGARVHAERVLARLGLGSAIEAVWAIEDAGLMPKPMAAAHQSFVEIHGIEPTRAAMLEDSAANLAVPKEMGMATILIGDGTPPAHVDRIAPGIMDFLAEAQSSTLPITDGAWTGRGSTREANSSTD
ncbi:MAG: pyrimidine 5'-nucleotidase [Pseudomonadota bacterium]